MKMNQKILLTAAIAGLFAAPAFAKPHKSDPSAESKCKDSGGYPIPCDGDDAKADAKKDGNGCGANGCGEHKKTETKETKTTTTTTTPAK